MDERVMNTVQNTKIWSNGQQWLLPDFIDDRFQCRRASEKAKVLLFLKKHNKEKRTSADDVREEKRNSLYGLKMHTFACREIQILFGRNSKIFALINLINLKAVVRLERHWLSEQKSASLMLSFSEIGAYLVCDSSVPNVAWLNWKPRSYSFLEKKIQDKQTSTDPARVKIIRWSIQAKTN